MPRPDDEVSCAWADHDYAEGARSAMVALADMIEPTTEAQRQFYEKYSLLISMKREAALRVIAAKSPSTDRL